MIASSIHLTISETDAANKNKKLPAGSFLFVKNAGILYGDVV